jgi:hypothetical protein
MGTPRGRGPQGTWRLQSPLTLGSKSGAIGHMAIPEPCRAVVLMPRSCGDARAFLRRGWAWSHEIRGDSRALSGWVTGSVPRGTWRHQSPLLEGGVLCAMGHVAEPEFSNTRSRSGAVGIRGDTGSLSCLVQSLAPRGWSFKSCAQGYPVCRVPIVAPEPTSGEATNPLVGLIPFPCTALMIFVLDDFEVIARLHHWARGNF